MATRSETGAPAALRRLEEHELRCAQEVDRRKAELTRLRAMQEPDGDEALRGWRQQIQNEVGNLSEAQDDWNKALKSLREFDKAVAPEKREGAKIPQSEVEQILTQAWRFQRMGREAFIISIAQDAIRCRDEQDFYAKYAESIRQCEQVAIQSGIDHEKYPLWVSSSYERSL